MPVEYNVTVNGRTYTPDILQRVLDAFTSKTILIIYAAKNRYNPIYIRKYKDRYQIENNLMNDTVVYKRLENLKKYAPKYFETMQYKFRIKLSLI